MGTIGSKAKNLLGIRFGLLTVKGYGFTSKTRAAYWKCICDCGEEKAISGRSLVCGDTTSCGCKLIKRNKLSAIHRESNPMTKEYATWRSIRSRCYNEAHKSYQRYGGRGIKVCDRWLSSYPFFLEDIGRAPSPAHSIERIDNNRDYEPGNCRWATRKEQQNNIRSNHHITYNGKTQTLAKWCDELELRGPHRKRVYSRAVSVTPFTPEQILSPNKLP